MYLIYSNEDVALEPMMITQEKSMKTVSSTHSSGNTIQDYLRRLKNKE